MVSVRIHIKLLFMQVLEEAKSIIRSLLEEFAKLVKRKRLQLTF